MITLNVFAAGVVALHAAGLYHAVQAAEAAGTLRLACEDHATVSARKRSRWRWENRATILTRVKCNIATMRRKTIAAVMQTRSRKVDTYPSNCTLGQPTFGIG